MLIAGADCQAAAAGCSRGRRPSGHCCRRYRLPESFARGCCTTCSGGISDYSHLFAAAATAGKNLMPRVATLLMWDKYQILSMKSADTFVRPIYAGNAMATVQSSDSVKVVTVRTTAFAEAGDGGNATISVSEHMTDQTMTQFLGEHLSVSERPELTAASIIVSGGRGMQDGSNFALLEKVATNLVQRSEHHVRRSMPVLCQTIIRSETGKIVAPDL